jgi:hypothetical protein
MARTTRSSTRQTSAVAAQGNNNPPRSSQEPGSNNTLEDPLETELRQLREQHEQAKKQLAILQARQERDRIQDQIDALLQEERQDIEVVTNQGAQDAADSGIQDPVDQSRSQRPQQEEENPQLAGTKHTRDDGALPPARSRPKTREPPIYKGLTLKEYEHFTRVCEKNFRVDPGAYPTEDSRVAYASQYLDGVPEAEWSRLEDLEGIDHTWKEFRDFLLNILKDPTNLKKDMSQRLTDARQRDVQSVREFAQYVDSLQDHLYTRAENPDSARIERLRTRVKAEIRRESDRHANVPTAYHEYVNHLANMEENVNRAKSRKDRGPQKSEKNEAPRGSGEANRGRRGNASSRGRFSRRNNSNSKASDPNEKPTKITCYNCGEEGHIKPNCPNPPKSKNQKTQ